jgi:hypothetical protein
MEAAWPLLPATMAIGSCYGSDPGQDPGGDRPALRGPLHRVGRGQPQPRAARLGRLLPLRQLRAEVRRHRQLRPRALGHLRQHQARPPVPPQLDPPVYLGVAAGSGGLSTQRTSAERGGACAAVNDVGKPCAGELHARFDRGPLADRGQGEPTRATVGKPAGLSPDTYSTGNQRPTSPPSTRRLLLAVKLVARRWACRAMAKTGPQSRPSRLG